MHAIITIKARSKHKNTFQRSGSDDAKLNKTHICEKCDVVASLTLYRIYERWNKIIFFFCHRAASVIKTDFVFQFIIHILSVYLYFFDFNLSHVYRVSCLIMEILQLI